LYARRRALHAWWGESRRALMLDMTPLAVPAHLVFGAAPSQRQPGRRCWRCGACEGTGNQPYTDRSLHDMDRAWRGKPRRALMLDVTPIAPHCAFSSLLGIAFSQHQPTQQCWCCGACKGAGNQQHADRGLHGVAHCMRDGMRRRPH